MDNMILTPNEKAVFALRSLYSSFGYTQYKMGKFEEYDLYMRNKDFLVSDHIISFTDTNGKLKALKPDVTLSIIRNSRDGDGTKKLYYDENVYRVSKGTDCFKEIMQTGLECIGEIDDYNLYEVLSLACRSLESISDEYVLDVSHLGVVSALLDKAEIFGDARGEVVKCIGEKNLHGIEEICHREGKDSEGLKLLISAYGTPASVISSLRTQLSESAELDELERIVTELTKSGFDGKVKLDFSVTGNMSYYNGFVFTGFISGISSGILTGGQYDRLMEKMGRKSKAVGFALYLDLLEHYRKESEKCDVDAVLLYDTNTPISALRSEISKLSEREKSVSALSKIPEKLTYKRLYKMTEKGAQLV